MSLEVFLYLQILDVISTLIGFSIGNTEASPFIRLFDSLGTGDRSDMVEVGRCRLPPAVRSSQSLEAHSLD